MNMDKNHKIKVGVMYRNIHTMKLCTVISKWFYMVEYKDEDRRRSSIHYKTFKKHWVEILNRNNLRDGCKKCGLDCTSNGGSQWLLYTCMKQYRKNAVDLLEAI